MSSSQQEFKKKTKISDEERLELATKLDRELDNFINNLPKRSQPEEIPTFERWEEEITKHPFFMKETPNIDDDNLHPLYEGLQKLKYDPDLNEPEELARSYKDDGNFNFKHKKYRMAIISYTEGLKTKCNNREIEATLYNNRSAAHYFLKNYRSAILDCEQALKLQPNYEKALHRLVQCYQQLEKYNKAIEYCDKILEQQPDNIEIVKLRQNCVQQQKLQQRNQRKRETTIKKQQQQQERLINEIIKRRIQIENFTTIEQLEPQFPQLFDSRVHLDEDNTNLIWPVILFYPEYKIMDYIQNFSENCRFLEQLNEIFYDFPDWDIEKKYKIDNIHLYYENNKGKYRKIDLNRTLLEILQSDDYILKEGTPRFIILIADSPTEKNFLQHC